MTWRRRLELDDSDRVVGFLLASAPSGISLLLGFVGALLDGGKRWFTCPGVPLFYMALHERGSTATNGWLPQSGREIDGIQGNRFP
jgi:hypothetical protein